MSELFDQDIQILQYLLREEAIDMPEVAEVQPRPREGIIPLSFAQQRLWFLHQLIPDTHAYNNLSAARLSGSLDLVALERSLNALIQRHEVLRTTFALIKGTPVQVIAPDVVCRLVVVDLQHVDGAAQERMVTQLGREDVQRPFDLSRDLLLRATVLLLGSGEYVLLLTTHHIVTDARSIAILYGELEQLYAACSAGRPALLPELRLQYADFAIWQRNHLNSGMLDEQLDFWKKTLHNAPAVLKMPYDKPRAASQTFRGVSKAFHVPKSETEALKLLSQRAGCTLFMVLLTAFQVLMHYYSGQDDIVVGTDVTNRDQPELEPIVGFFVNQLALRTDLSGNPAFRELLRRVRKVTLDAYAHRDIPFDHLVQLLRIERALDYAPIFQVKIFLLHGDIEQLRLPGLKSQPLDIDSQVARLDLTFLLSETTHGLEGWINYNSDLFSDKTIARLEAHFKTLLASVSTDPNVRIQTLVQSIARKEEEHKIMEKSQRDAANLQKFKQVARKVVSLPDREIVTLEELRLGASDILMVQPAETQVDLADWSRSQREMIETKLLHYGAVLFRGFQITNSALFERFALSVCQEIFKENSEHVPVTNNGNVQTPVFYPAYKKLLWHNENTFNDIWPMKIMFGCVQPAQEGGETPLVDSRKMIERIPAEICAEFQAKQIMYVRNFDKGLGLDWQTVFRTTDKAEVEAKCRKAAIEFEWRDGDRLRTRAIRPALGRHPLTGATVWFNQAPHWHIACLDETTRSSLLAIFAEEDMPRHCYYGDGSPIDDSTMQVICQAYEHLEVSFAWQAGDVLLIDNMLAAHARNPFVGERKLLVAMGEMIDQKSIHA